MKIIVNKQIISLLLIFHFGLIVSMAKSKSQNIFDERIISHLGKAKITTLQNILIVETGLLKRQWQWTGKGLVTVSLVNLGTGKEWVTNRPHFSCDWHYPGLIDENTDAQLVNLTAKPIRYDPFTSDHIKVVAEIAYPVPKITVKYVIWVYPNSPGVRTQLYVKAMAGFLAKEENFSDAARVEYIPVSDKNVIRRAVGYYNHTQARNKRETEILKDEIYDTPVQGSEIYDWANMVCLEKEPEGLVCIKESHKCVNQHGVNTGRFEYGQTGLISTGWALHTKDILKERFQPCWASWCIVYDGGDNERELAIKIFDRIRYPVDPARDIYIMANTWGSTDDKRVAQTRASEENVLREIKSQSDLGIDVQQIDDGWQGNDYDSWRPVEERYPDGWVNMINAAYESGITLGLWAAGERINLEDLKYNFDRGGFRYYKLDFIGMENYREMTDLMSKVRSFIDYTGHTVRVNWDVTENAPRVGYYFAREYGNIYLENRKPVRPEKVVYIPYLVLRDAWQVSKYTNLNKFQVTVQNIDRVNREASDAYLHHHPYCVAITLMGSPIFFQETQYYTEEARKQIKPLLALYKKHREEMYRGYVFPIGAKPDNSSWTGFQNHNPKTQAGYITLFRELQNKQVSKTIHLRFLAGKKIRLHDLRSDIYTIVNIGVDGAVDLQIESTPDFRFMKYGIVD